VAAAHLAGWQFFQRPALQYSGGIDQDVDVLPGHGTARTTIAAKIADLESPPARHEHGR
jgi:hypothetical protein